MTQMRTQEQNDLTCCNLLVNPVVPRAQQKFTHTQTKVQLKAAGLFKDIDIFGLFKFL